LIRDDVAWDLPTIYRECAEAIGIPEREPMSTVTFDDLGLAEPLLRAISDEGYSEPTPIQQTAIPSALAGRDIIGTAKTGTGKTAAFALPLLQKLIGRPKSDRKHISAVILTPTRELALQIDESVRNYGRHVGVRTVVVLGGVKSDPQIRKLQQGVDVVVATPGRMLDLMRQGHVQLGRVEVFVLDEADRMLDMGFVHDVRQIEGHVPKERQTFFFSATMSPAIRSLASTMLVDPETVAVTPPASVADNIDQQVMYVDMKDKPDLLAHVLSSMEVDRTLIFTRTKVAATHVARQLDGRGISAEAIHSNKTQSQRQRALAAFDKGRVQVLVATDIMARGIDVEDITHVINYELPEDAENYVHRIGRTARAGKAGVALSLCDLEEISLLRNVERFTRIPLRVVEDQPYHSVGVAACRDAATRKAKSRSRAGSARGSGSKWSR